MPDVRLIDANAIVEKLQSYYEALSPDVQSELIRRDEVSSCIAELINAPTIDAQPIIHAHWIMLDKRVGECSNCGYCQKSNGIDKTGRGNIHKSVYKWCAMCGAKMDGGDADEQH